MTARDQNPGLYQDPFIYDVLHAPGTAEGVDGLARIAHCFGGSVRGRRPVWLEPACGTGRFLRVAARRGVRAVGFDLSETMVAYAKKRVGPGGRVFVADMTAFADKVGRGRVDFAFNPINTIRHLRSDGEMLAHFEQMSLALRPRGVYAVGLSTSAYGLEAPSEDVWEGARGRVRVRQIVQYEPPSRGRTERVFSHLIVTRGSRVEHHDSAYGLRCYSGEQWRRLIGRSALELLAVVDEWGEPLEPGAFGYAVYVLRPRNRRGA